MKRSRWLIILGGAGCAVGLLAWLLNARATAQIDSYAACARAGYPITDSNPPVCQEHGRNFTGPLASASPMPAAAADSQPFELLVEGDSGGTYPQRQELIRTPADWQRYWRQVHAGLPSQPPLLPVDFTHSDVIALSEGRQPTTGYSLKITSIMTAPTGTTVNAVETIPSVTCIVAQHVTNRYYIVRTPKLPNPVTIHVTPDKHKCS